jgi:squalene-hopene/tetraprenyl-beta-curcumene cyclase
MSDAIRLVTPVSDDALAQARGAMERACQRLFATQDPRGFWKGELETNVTMDAEDLLLREFLGIRTAEETKHAALWIRSQQRADGSWGTFRGGPPELSTTIEAYVALRLAGDPVDAAHMRRAAELVRAHGGLERSRVFTRFWMALFGLWSWDDLPALPPEVIFLPPWFPLNIYDFGCWARQTIVPLTVVASHRPRRRLAFAIDELRTGVMPPPPSDSLSTWAGRFQLLDRALHWYERHPLRWLRRTALRVAAEWILRRQEHDGGWGGIQPPWVYSIIALHLLGYPLDHPALAKALSGLAGFTLDPNGRRRLEACQSPVWDTALAVVGLNDAGIAADQPNLVRAIDWILREEIRVPGDWAVRRPKLEPGGWAFEFANDNYPDIDDTAEVVLALRGAAAPGARADVDAAIRRGVAWTVGMQSSNHGWAAFDVDNTSRLCAELPFCDFGEVTDPPSADVTAHVLEMLAVEGQASTDAARRGRAWLLRAQEADGSWFGRWGANYVYGTGAALPALVACQVPTTDASVRRAVVWLEEKQNPDGGWGEDLRSYLDRKWAGRGKSTASQTAWALLGLLAADGRSPAVERGVHWLVANQRVDGDWDEPEFTGTGFPGDFYIRYHMYRIVFPLMALGRYVRRSAS